MKQQAKMSSKETKMDSSTRNNCLREIEESEQKELGSTALLGRQISLKGHGQTGEWLIEWAKEVHHISWIVWKTLFIKLPAIETINKKTQSALKRIWATRKATRSTSEASQIMTEFSIISFD